MYSDIVLLYFTGKTRTAIALAERYNVKILSIDKIVIEAISKGTPYGLEARKICEAETRRRAEEAAKLTETTDDGERKADGLSVAAVTAHSQLGGALHTQPGAGV